MKEFEIVPHVGIGPVKLGMTKAEVHTAIGEPEHVAPDGREGFLKGLMVDFNEDGIVEFIEIADSPEFRGVFQGQCLHKIPAEEAVALVSQFGDYDPDDPELGHSYTFVGLQVSLWRGTMPSPDQAKDDMDGRFFEAVGVAEDGYFEIT